MFRIPRSRPLPPQIDLSTVRETLAYIQDDMERVPELKGVAAALSATLTEIDRVKPRPTLFGASAARSAAASAGASAARSAAASAGASGADPHPRLAARFLPWRGSF